MLCERSGEVRGGGRMLKRGGKREEDAVECKGRDAEVLMGV